MEFNGLKNQFTTENDIFNEKIKEKRGAEIMYGTFVYVRSNDYQVKIPCENDAQVKWLKRHYSEYDLSTYSYDGMYVYIRCEKKENFDRLLRELVEASGMTVYVGGNVRFVGEGKNEHVIDQGAIMIKDKYNKLASQVVEYKMQETKEFEEKEREEFLNERRQREQDNGMEM